MVSAKIGAGRGLLAIYEGEPCEGGVWNYCPSP